MDVRAAGFHADLADAGEAGIAHELPLLVGQRLDGRDRDRVARVHTHGIKVFNGANDDAVVSLVAHHFGLVFLPTDERFFDEDLGNRRGLDTALRHGIELFTVIGDAAARAAERVSRANDNGESANRARHLTRLLHRVGHTTERQVEADFLHCLFELQAVLALLDGLRLRPNHFHAMLLQDTVTPERHGRVEASLAAECWQERVGFLAFDDLLNRLRRDRLDVRRVGEFRIGHDRGRVRIHQHDLVTLFAQGFAGLRSRVIKLASLANHDRPAANDQNLVDVGSLRHLADEV